MSMSHDEAISSQLWINQTTTQHDVPFPFVWNSFFRDVDNQLLVHCKKRTRSWPISLKIERWYFVLVLAQPSFWTSILIDCNRKKVDIVSIVFLTFIYKLVIFYINNIVLIFFSRASQIMRGVGQRCSLYHNTHQRPHPAASSASSTSSSNGSGSPPSSVHMGQLGKTNLLKKEIKNNLWLQDKLMT